MRFFLSAWFAGLLMLAGVVPAVAACDSISVEANVFSVCSFDPAKVQIRMFSLDPDGQPFGGFMALERMLAERGEKLDFAMNGGMFDENLKPIGLYVENGLQAKRLNRRGGAGNFHLKPNGVFFITGGKATVMETDAYAKLAVSPVYATQSGPMLVVNGKIHPKISADGTSEKIRNGVGVRADGTVVFAVSDTVVTFYEFATLFRDQLDCPNALFLDGSVSSLYAPELNRADGLVPLGPMVAVVEKR